VEPGVSEETSTTAASLPETDEVALPLAIKGCETSLSTAVQDVEYESLEETAADRETKPASALYLASVSGAILIMGGEPATIWMVVEAVALRSALLSKSEKVYEPTAREPS